MLTSSCSTWFRLVGSHFFLGFKDKGFDNRQYDQDRAGAAHETGWGNPPVAWVPRLLVRGWLGHHRGVAVIVPSIGSRRAAVNLKKTGKRYATTA